MNAHKAKALSKRSADLRTDEMEWVRIANGPNWESREAVGEAPRAWSKSKTNRAKRKIKRGYVIYPLFILLFSKEEKANWVRATCEQSAEAWVWKNKVLEYSTEDTFIASRSRQSRQAQNKGQVKAFFLFCMFSRRILWTRTRRKLWLLSFIMCNKTIAPSVKITKSFLGLDLSFQ